MMIEVVVPENRWLLKIHPGWSVVISCAHCWNGDAD